jgi:hypothetical protein
MATVIVVAGVDIELAEDESFNKLRHRMNRARRMHIDYENGNIDGTSDGQKFEPYHELSFKTAAGGRVTVPVDKVLYAYSDKAKDVE